VKPVHNVRSAEPDEDSLDPPQPAITLAESTKSTSPAIATRLIRQVLLGRLE
jgi:hypothetical protein